MTAILNFTEGQLQPDAQRARALGELNVSVARGEAPTQTTHATESPTSVSHTERDPHIWTADGSNPPDAIAGSRNQKTDASGDQLAESIESPMAHTWTDSATNFTSGQESRAAHPSPAAGDPTPAGGQRTVEPQNSDAPGGFLNSPMLALFAKVVDDFEGMRIATANRVRIFTQTEADPDGIERGFGLPVDMREIERLNATVAAMEKAEHDAILALQRAVRKHPLGDFQRRYRGLGEKQFARLLGVIGDPYWNDLHDRPRTVSELWAYAGYHVIQTSGSQNIGVTQSAPAAGATVHTGSHGTRASHSSFAPGVAPKRTRGQRSNWSEDARKRCFVIAESLMKGGRKSEDSRGPQDETTDHFRIVYDATRAKYAESVHAVDCIRCGPAGKPALAGSPLSDAHKHARALRAVAKEFLKLLWLEARSKYFPDGHTGSVTHLNSAVRGSSSTKIGRPQ